MVMDVIRSAYRTQVRPYPDSDDEVGMTWFFAKRGAKVFPHYHVFASGNWASEKFGWKGPGEVEGAPRPYFKGARPPGKDGREFHGPVEGFRGELLKADAVPLELGPDGSPKCDEPDAGGVGLGGKQALFLRPSPWRHATPGCRCPSMPNGIRIVFDDAFTHGEGEAWYSEGLDGWFGTGIAYMKAGFHRDEPAPFEWKTPSYWCGERVFIRNAGDGEDGWVWISVNPNAPDIRCNPYTYHYDWGFFGYPSPWPGYIMTTHEFTIYGLPVPVISKGDPALGGTFAMYRGRVLRPTGGVGLGGEVLVSKATRTIDSKGPGMSLGGTVVMSKATRTIGSRGGVGLGGTFTMTDQHPRSIGGVGLGGTSEVQSNPPAIRQLGGVGLGGTSEVSSRLRPPIRSGGGVGLGGSQTVTPAS